MKNIDYLIYVDGKVLTGNTKALFKNQEPIFARFTGLTDKDGKKIYEYCEVSYPYQDRPRKSVITYEDCNARFVMEVNGNVYSLDDYIAKDLKVISYFQTP